MTPFFTRVKLAFAAFFSILFHDRLPDAVSRTFAAPAPTPQESPPAPAVASEPTATQVLAVLQRDGRLIDFLMEDISAYGDAQIGAAVRDVHRGSRDALCRYVTLAPVLDNEEGSTVTVEAATDAARVKLIGNVAGHPPFRGVLRHRGWVVTSTALPPLSASGRSIIAPAEVEVA